MNFLSKIPGPFLVFLGACALSFGGLIVKSFDGSTLWQILFWRSLFFIGVITIFLIFTYKGKILNPVVGWTSHHSICEFKGKWYLFYHDSSLSKGVTHLRSIKIAEIQYDEDGLIKTLDPYNDFPIL